MYHCLWFIYHWTLSFRNDWVWADSVPIILYVSWNARTMKNISTTIFPTNSSTLMPQRPSKVEGIAWCIAFTLEALLIVLGNFLTLVLFAVNKRLRKRSLFLVINMAFADLLSGAVSLPILIYTIGVGFMLWKARLDKTFYAYQVFGQIVEVACFSKSIADKFLVFNWSHAQGISLNQHSTTHSTWNN